MARVLVSASFALAAVLLAVDRSHNVFYIYGVRPLGSCQCVRSRLDLSLHESSISSSMNHICFFFDATRLTSVSALLSRNHLALHTSKAIQLIGSSLGISVFFTSSNSNVSSSNATVIITPGGVHVPIIRWCLTILSIRRAYGGAVRFRVVQIEACRQDPIPNTFVPRSRDASRSDVSKLAAT